MNKIRLLNIGFLVFFTFLLSCTFSEKQIVVDQCGMEPAIKIGDKVKYIKFNGELTYGDIILFEVSENRPDWTAISRVAGLPGDRVAIENDICIINGKKNEHRLIDKQFSFYEYEETLPNGVKFRAFSFAPYSKSFYRTVTVPANHYFLMGDYRSSNVDSRITGPISRDRIIGKVTDIHRQ
jgi:signal peptidase I